MLIITGLFANESQAEDAHAYLLGNGFADSSETLNSNVLNVSELQGCTVKLTMQTAIEAQEGADVLNNYGALEIQNYS